MQCAISSHLRPSNQRCVEALLESCLQKRMYGIFESHYGVASSCCPMEFLFAMVCRLHPHRGGRKPAAARQAVRPNRSRLPKRNCPTLASPLGRCEPVLPWPGGALLALRATCLLDEEVAYGPTDGDSAMRGVFCRAFDRRHRDEERISKRHQLKAEPGPVPGAPGSR